MPTAMMENKVLVRPLHGHPTGISSNDPHLQPGQPAREATVVLVGTRFPAISANLAPVLLPGATISYQCFAGHGVIYNGESLVVLNYSDVLLVR